MPSTLHVHYSNLNRWLMHLSNVCSTNCILLGLETWLVSLLSFTEVIPNTMHTMHAILTPCACVVNVILVGSQNLALLTDILEMKVIYCLCRTIKIDDKIASGQMKILDQTSLIKFATLHCQRTTEIYEMLQEVYDDSTIHHCKISHWSQTFCQGQNNTEDKTHCGRLKTCRENT